MNKETEYSLSNGELDKYQAIGSYGTNYEDIDKLDSQIKEVKDSKDNNESEVAKKTGTKKAKRGVSIISALIVSCAIGMETLLLGSLIDNDVNIVKEAGVIRAIGDCWVQDNIKANVNYSDGRIYYGHLDLKDFIYDGVKEKVSFGIPMSVSPVGNILEQYVFNEGTIDGDVIIHEIENFEEIGYCVEYVKVGDEVYTKEGGEPYIMATKTTEYQATPTIRTDENGKEVVTYSLPNGGTLVGDKGIKKDIMFVKVNGNDVDLPDGYSIEKIVVSKPYSEFDEINYKVEYGEATYTLKKSK